jgi:uncharacterized OB-fold protein
VNPEPTLRPQPVGIPAPSPSRLSQPYWDACLAGELRFQRCDACGTIPARPSPICPRCHSRSLSWQRSAGTGSLYSWTVVWRPQHPSFRVPYAPAIIELDEAWFLMSAMVGCEPEDLAPGLRVVVEFHPAGEGIALPYFRPSSEV